MCDQYYKRKKNQFLVLAGNRFWLYILLCTWSTIVVVLCYFFWFWWEIIFSVLYVLSVQYSCAVVSLSSVWRVLDHYYDRKKSSSRLSGGCAIVIMTGKKVLDIDKWLGSFSFTVKLVSKIMRAF